MWRIKNDIGLLPSNSDRYYDTCLAINEIGDRAIGEIKTCLLNIN